MCPLKISTQMTLKGGMAFLELQLNFLVEFEVEVEAKMKFDVLDNFISVEVQFKLQLKLQYATHLKFPSLNMVISI